MDITKLAVKETTEIHLKDAEGALLYDGDQAVTVTVYGPGSKPFVKAQGARNRRMMEMVKSKAKGLDTTLDDNAEFLASVTVGFRHFEYKDLSGRDLARAVYSDISIGFIADQVMREVGDWANFSSGSTTA